MLVIAVVVVWASLLGLSPGLVLVAGAAAMLAVDRLDGTILDRILR